MYWHVLSPHFILKHVSFLSRLTRSARMLRDNTGFIWKKKKSFARSARAVFTFLYISLPFYPWREITCFAVVWTTQALGRTAILFVFFPSRNSWVSSTLFFWSQLNSFNSPPPPPPKISVDPPLERKTWKIQKLRFESRSLYLTKLFE